MTDSRPCADAAGMSALSPQCHCPIKTPHFQAIGVRSLRTQVPSIWPRYGYRYSWTRAQWSYRNISKRPKASLSALSPRKHLYRHGEPQRRYLLTMTHHQHIKGAYLTDMNPQADWLPSLPLRISPSGIDTHTRSWCVLTVFTPQIPRPSRSIADL
jgi:hypothetical protein